MAAKTDVVIVDGVRTPFAKAGTDLREVSAQELGRHALRELLERTHLDPETVDDVFVGNIAGPSDAANVARVIALRAGIPERVPALTVNRNCASSLESLAQGAMRIRAGEASVVVAGGTESMSQIPLLFGRGFTRMFEKLARARSLGARLAALASFRPGFLKPRVALLEGLTDPVSGLNMGQTAELLAREFRIPREEQDAFALESHRRAVDATREGRLAGEIAPIPVPPRFDRILDTDVGPRPQQTLEALAKLRPVFDRRNGTVTAGNSSMITDGAVMLLLMSAERAQELGHEPLGRVRSWAFAGLDPARMGLGPVHATPPALKKARVAWKDIELVELNEAFAAQALACRAAFASSAYAKEKLGLARAVGELDPERLNVNGGAIALGHPVGSSGGRIVLTLLREMKRREATLGLATLCVGGGQGGAFVLERS
jgi:acetyl-CoA acyltransferase